MKKRILSLLLIAVMAFTVLAGCGSKDVETPETPGTEAQDPAFSADLAEFYNKIMAAAEEGPFMMDLAAEAEFMDNFYPGLSAIETKQLVAYTPAMTGVAVEFVFVEVANAADVDTVKTILQTRIDDQKTEGMGKYPTTTAVWEKHSEIVVIDNYVCLFVCTEKDGMVEAFRNGTEVPAWAKAQAPVEGEGDIEGGIMDMPVEDGPAAYDPETDVPAFDPEAETPAEPSETPAEPSTPAVEPETPAVDPEPAPEAAPVDGRGLAAFYDSLYARLYPLDEEGYSTGPFVEDFAQAPEMLEGFYPGLTAIAAKQLHVYMPAMSGVPYEVALIEVENASDVDAVKTILQTRIDTEKSNRMNYPMVIENWELNSRIVTNGNYIMMAVTSDCDAYVDAFNALF